MSKSFVGSARGAVASAHVKRWRVATVALLVLAMVGSLLALAVPPPSEAGAQEPPPGVTTSTSWDTDCLGGAAGIFQSETNSMGFDVTAPAQVAQDEVFTIRIAPKESSFPDQRHGTLVGTVTLFNLQNINFMYNLPTNSSVESIEIVPGTSHGISGSPSLSIDNSYSPARIVLAVSEVPKNPTPPTNETFFRLPAVDVTVRATGSVGSSITTRVPGTNYDTAGYVFQALTDFALANVRCWPFGDVPAPIMSTTVIGGGGGETVPTTTSLSATPTTIPGGGEVTMTAVVSAPSGLVRFDDGGTVLGFEELDTEGVAVLTTSLNNLGSRQITATYMGSPLGFEPSTSDVVSVFVTNPANRTPVRVTVVPTAPIVTSSSAQLFTVTVARAPALTNASNPSGLVHLYRNDELVDSQPLVAPTSSSQGSASATFNVPLADFGNEASLFRAVYPGDTLYLNASGTAPVAKITSSSNDTTSAVNRALSGSIELNDVGSALPSGTSTGIPTGSILQSSYAALDAAGNQTLDGILLFPGSMTLADDPVSPSVSVTGQLAQVGLAEGNINPGSDASAALTTRLVFQVQSANLGSGVVSYASSCTIGPFEVTLTGSRVGVDGLLSLSASGFGVPFPAPGTCLNPSGVSQYLNVGGVVSGALAGLTFSLTPPGAPAATSMSVVAAVPSFGTPPGESSYLQPVSLSAEVTRDDGQPMPSGYIYGSVDWYKGDVLVGTTNLNNPAGTSSISIPSAGSGNVPLPVGDDPLYAVFRSGNNPRGMREVRPSPLGPTSPWVVHPKVNPPTPTVTMSVPATAMAGEVVEIDLQISPTPEEVVGPVPLEGTIFIIDELSSQTLTDRIRINSVPDGGTVSSQFGGLTVQSKPDGHYTVSTVLTPGEHKLRADYTPGNAFGIGITDVEWYWGESSSATHDHTVTGPSIPTQLEVVRDSTVGTGKVPQGSPFWVEAEVFPKAAVSNELNSALWSISNTGEELFTQFTSTGRAVVQVVGVESLPPGHYERTIQFLSNKVAPSSLGGINLNAVGNQGFASSSATVSFEVIPPATMDNPLETRSMIESVTPNVVLQGTGWSQILGWVTYTATGTVNQGNGMRYTARNMQTGDVTFLGAVAPSISTTSSGRGRALLSGSALSNATNSLPAGSYEVVGEFLPNTGAPFLPSTTDPFVVHVLSAGEQAGTFLDLSVWPSGVSSPGTAVILEAVVSPAGLGAGTVQFLDGDEPLGDPVATVDDVASLVTFDLDEGDHQLSAVFTPSDPTLIVGSETLEPVSHTVGDATIPTATELSVDPSEAHAGQDVTFTASVEALVEGDEELDLAGTVTFEADGDLGSAPLVEGVATLVTDELAVGTHEVVATFVPDDPNTYGESTSEPVTVTITEAPVGPVETGTTLAISPEDSAVVGSEVILTATIDPSSATGTVSFLDGDTVIAGPVAVAGGQAEVAVDSLSLGVHSLSAAFTPDDPEAYQGSASPAQDYEINTDFAEPAFECQGADQFSVGIMTGLVAPPDGILFLGTQLDATVPETLANGGSGNVAFTWSVTLPEALANLAIDAEAAEIIMEDMDIAMVASGGSAQLWELPDNYTITDPTAPITLETFGTVNVSTDADVVYSMRSPLNITIHVPPTPIVHQDVYVKLSCVVHNATQAITQVQGGATAPGAPTEVTAEAGPLMAHVSWAPPANDGGSPITGYIVTASPGGKTTHTSAEVTHVDVIGLEEGQDYTFTVQATNEVGEGEASDPSNAVTPGPGVNFSDVPSDHPFYAEIEWLAATGITTGMSPGFFGADLNLTRQAMAAFLYRLSGSPDGTNPTCTEMPFPDVSLENDFCGEITWLANEGITQGNPDGTFNPTGNLSRQAMSAFLYRLANGPDTPAACTTAPYPDVPAGDQFCPYIEWMGETGITQTPPGDNFRPNDALTRQAMAAFLYRYTLVVPTEL